MKHLVSAVALAVCAAAPVAANAGSITIDFEHLWDGGNGDIGQYYNGGKAAVGPATGPQLGAVFANISGINNDPAFPVYSGAPSPIGTAYAEGSNAFIDFASGVYGFSFFYSSPVSILGAVKAYSGLDGTGTLLGSLDVTANSGDYSAFSLATLAFSGAARSFDLSALASGDTTALFDNVTVVPEPGVLALLVTGGGALAMFRRKATKR